jgi:hypothetical protein
MPASQKGQAGSELAASAGRREGGRGPTAVGQRGEHEGADGEQQRRADGANQ